jgi:REP element-mobilizing transposase RayT
MARPIRIEYPGAVYHVICRGNNRQAIFRDDADRKRYLEKLSRYCQEKNVDILSYCLLSNHVHLLVETPQGNLSKLMQAFQTSYTVYFNKRHGRTGHVFEQRYKAMVVDKDNYLLQVSRYIHLNPVSARIVERPQDFRWSSYGSYLKGKGLTGLKTESVLAYFSGSRSRQLRQYRDYVEGDGSEKSRNPAPEVIKQVFIGDDYFAEATRRKGNGSSVYEGHYSFRQMVEAVSAVMGTEREEIRRPQRSERVQRSREILCYIARRHGEVGVQELARFLQVKELSTASHAVRRAEKRLKEDSGFRRRVEQVLKRLDSTMQA